MADIVFVEFMIAASAAALAWHYVGYPAAISLQAAAIGNQSGDEDELPTPTPSVSVVLPVRNEEERIGRRLRNLMAQDYPGELEVLVVANGCTDDTVRVTGSLKAPGDPIRILESPASEGKAGALNRGVAASEGDVVVFADARQTFAESAVRRLVAALSRHGVGAASGALNLRSADAPAALRGVGLYWKLERWVRYCEGVTGSTVGVTGAIYAIRRELFEPLPSGLVLDDVWVPMKVVFAGKRTVFVPSAVATDETGEDPWAEFRRKVRTLAGNYQLLRVMPELLRPDRNPIFLRYVSHRILRLGSPFFLLVILSGFFLNGAVFQILATGVGILVVTGLLGLAFSVKAFSGPAAFLLANAAAFSAPFAQYQETDALWARKSE